MPTVSVSIEPSQSAITLKTIFDFLNQSTNKVYIAIDEFQQISYYPEQGLEAQLRSYIQFTPNVSFIFSGSKQHLMAQVFHSPERPFYQSTASMGLAPLHEEIYHDFANQFLKPIEEISLARCSALSTKGLAVLPKTSSKYWTVFTKWNEVLKASSR